MPHCVIEYSKELESYVNPKDLLSAVYAGALASGLFSAPDIKVRAIAFDNFVTGDTDRQFVHVTTKILSGRSLERRAELSNAILAKLTELLKNPISITVEISEIENAAYAKIIK